MKLARGKKIAMTLSYSVNIILSILQIKKKNKCPSRSTLKVHAVHFVSDLLGLLTALFKDVSRAQDSYANNNPLWAPSIVLKETKALDQ